MADKMGSTHTEAIEQINHGQGVGHPESLEKAAPMEHIEEYQDAVHINLTWKSWMVVFVSCFAIMAQVRHSVGVTPYARRS